jgi:hypothetical protein
MSISLIEDLSNEIFYKIFEYLDGCEIYKIFSNVNYRFEQLLNSSSFSFKIEFNCSTSNEFYINICKQHQILSFHVWSPLRKNDIFFSISIDSSFNH